jgi:leader peptidase (prepilin peptidase)/N-methyltransferase
MSFTLAIILVLILGTAVGSFLNVVILRQGAQGAVGGSRNRSMCLSCGKKLESRDLFPIFSFILLRGRCRYCKCRISRQYPLVEIFTGLLFLLAFLNVYEIRPAVLAVFDGLALAFIFSVLIVIFVYDLRHKVISDWSVIILGIAAFLRVILVNWGNFGSSAFLLDLLAGPLAAAPFCFLWLISRGRWMGLGDGKLMFGLGWLLGWSLWLPATILAFWLGALVSILLMFLKELKNQMEKFPLRRLPDIGLKTEIPFGPFLIIAALISFLFNFNVINAISGFFL